MEDLFDETAQRHRLTRATQGEAGDLFLHERAFREILDRLQDIRREFGRACILGLSKPDWVPRLRQLVGDVDDEGLLELLDRDKRSADAAETCAPHYDLIVAIGVLEIVNDLPARLRELRTRLNRGGLLIGASLGGESLPCLRSAMIAANSASGIAVPHVHPRIEPATLAAILAAAGFSDPVVDVDRVNVRYPSFQALVADLRAMGATNTLSARSRRPLPRAAVKTAAEHFRSLGDGRRTTEVFEIMHFAAWAEG